MNSPAFFFSQGFLAHSEFCCHTNYKVTLPIFAKEAVRILIGIMLHLYIILQSVSTGFFFFMVWFGFTLYPLYWLCFCYLGKGASISLPVSKSVGHFLG